MAGFSDLLDGIDGAIEEHLCDDALYSVDGVTFVGVRIQIDHPTPADRLQAISFTRTRPVLRVAKAVCPTLKEGHFFRHGADLWEAAEAPTADGDGRWWVVEVMPG